MKTNKSKLCKCYKNNVIYKERNKIIKKIEKQSIKDQLGLKMLMEVA